MKNIFRKRNPQTVDAQGTNGAQLPGEQALAWGTSPPYEGESQEVLDQPQSQPLVEPEAVDQPTGDYIDQMQEADYAQPDPSGFELAEAVTDAEPGAESGTATAVDATSPEGWAEPAEAVQSESWAEPAEAVQSESWAAIEPPEEAARETVSPPESVPQETLELVSGTSGSEQAELTPAAPLESNNGWASRYVIPGMESILLEIQALERSIQELESRKAQLQQGISQQGELRDALLTGSGLDLTCAVQLILNEMGVSADRNPEDENVLVLDHKGMKFVGQVVASDGPITLGDVRQLNHRVEEFIEVYEHQPKGLLVANTFTGLPLTDRDTNGHTGFPDSLRLLAEQRYRFCLLTTSQLFVAYCKFKKKQLNVNEFITELFETVWTYGNHRDFERFRILAETV